jgi:hypothetical protein
LHAHAEDSTHTAGTRPELLQAAKRSGVRIVMLSDHVRKERDFINDSWRGLKDGVLFIPGAESEGFLAYPTASIQNKKWQTRAGFIDLIKQGRGNIFLSHVEEKLDWETDGVDGLEIYNHHTDIKDEAEFTLWLRASFTDPVRLFEIDRALSEFPDEVFASQQDYLTDVIQKWDHDTQKHRLTGVAANDCHHNQVFTVTAINEETVELGYITSRPTTTRVTVSQSPGIGAMLKNRRAGELIAKLDFDPYERSLSYVTTHILTRSLSEDEVREALGSGRAYVSHDWLCDPTGFAFVGEFGPSAASAGPRRKKAAPVVMGGEVQLKKGLVLRAAAPVSCTLKVLRNGVEVKSVHSSDVEFRPMQSGVYRIEAWLTLDDEMRPWIYSNPIYVR